MTISGEALLLRAIVTGTVPLTVPVSGGTGAAGRGEGIDGVVDHGVEQAADQQRAAEVGSRRGAPGPQARRAPVGVGLAGVLRQLLRIGVDDATAGGLRQPARRGQEGQRNHPTIRSNSPPALHRSAIAPPDSAAAARCSSTTAISRGALEKSAAERRSRTAGIASRNRCSGSARVSITRIFWLSASTLSRRG